MADDNKFEESVVSEVGYQKATEKEKDARRTEIDAKYKQISEEISKGDIAKENSDTERE